MLWLLALNRANDSIFAQVFLVNQIWTFNGDSDIGLDLWFDRGF